jgi:hypothetical protein
MVAQVEATAARLDEIAENLNHARLNGWIKEAIEAEEQRRLRGGDRPVGATRSPAQNRHHVRRRLALEPPGPSPIVP